ncbi:putative rRNA-processing protein EBP2 [Cichlidogyrus casuarinus]|uniref:rRNA-processing protein EBP2 n=1 Tax=Cichlidogyrus casuarinus TaxID=1844966 RepID=A0ABD2Q1M3_9PLAT
MSDSEAEDLQELLACPGLYQEVPETKRFVNNKNALNRCAQQLELDLPWIQRLDLVVKPTFTSVLKDEKKDKTEIDVNNDFERESFFYRQAQAGVLEGLKRLHELGIPTKRPTDYFAEMIKTDQHMNKIREQLVAQKKRIELAERARQLRDQRKFGKKTQIEVLNARKQEKKRLNEAVKAARKKSAKGQKFDLDAVLEEVQAETNMKKRDNGLDRHLNKVSKKRDYKNRRFGFGGQKKRSKWNDKQSADNFKDFKVLTHQPTAGRVKKLKKQMIKSKKKNQQKQKKKIASMSC